MKGELNYSEYSCPCDGRISRRKHDLVNKGFFKDKYIFYYYYECDMCGKTSGMYEADITEQVRGDIKS